MSRSPFRGLQRTPIPCWIALGLILALFGSAAAVPPVQTLGPFDVSFYGPSDGQDEMGETSARVWTSQQMDDVAASIAAWAGGIVNLPQPTRQIKYHVFWHAYGDGTLGATYVPRNGNGTTSWSYAEGAWREGSMVASPDSYDVWTDFDTTTSWNYGSGAPSGTMDFRSVVTHELGHSVGFWTTYDNGSRTFSSQGLSGWDKLLWDGSHSPSLTAPAGTFNATHNPVWFTGTQAKAAYGGANVPVYAPNPYQSGSSLSHLNQSTFPSALMAPIRNYGIAVRAPTTLEWAILQDLGWTVAVPQSWTKGAGTLNWTGAGNWSPGGAPTRNSTITLTNTGLNNGDTLTLGGDQEVNALTVDATNNFTLGGAANSLTVRSGTITRTAASSGTQTIASPVALSGNAIWDIDGSGQLVLAGGLSGPGSLYKISPGMVVLAGPSTLTNDLTISAGDVTLAAGGSLTVRSVTGAAGSLNFDGGSLTQTGTNTLHLYGVRVGKAAVGSFTLGPGKTLIADTLLTIGRDSGGQGTFTNRSGTVTCGTNLFVGAYTGSSGTFIQQTDPGPGAAAPSTAVTSGTYLGYQGGSGQVQIASGTFTTQDLQIGPAGPGTFTQTGGTVSVSGQFQLAGGAAGTYNLNGGTLVSGQWTKGTGTPAFNFGGGTFKASATFATSIPITINAGGGTMDTSGYTLTVNSAVGGAGGLTKLGAGTVSLAVANTFGGETTPKAGTLSLGNANALQGTTLNLATGDTGSVSFGSLTAAALGGLEGQRALALPSNFALTIGGNGQATTYSGSISGTGASLTKTGGGVSALAGADSYSGGTTVAGGTLLVGHPDALLAGSDLAIRSGAQVTLGSGLAKAVQVRSLSLAGGTSPTCTLDMGDGQLVVDGTVTPVATVGAQIASAYNLLDPNNPWKGPGITSSNAVAYAERYAVGYALNSDFGDLAFSNWFGRTVSGSSVLVRYTYLGDTDLNGQVTTDDFDDWKQGYTTHQTGWLHGDLDYSGDVTTDDFDLWKQVYVKHYAPMAGGTGGATVTTAGVPEPGVAVLVAIGGLGLLAWRRRMLPFAPRK